MADYLITKITDVGGNPRFETVNVTVSDPVFNSLGIGVTPDASAIFDVSSTTKGVLFPRMTSTQRNDISSPAEGLQIYDLTNNKMDFHNGTAWKAFVSSPSSTFIPGCVMFATDTHEIDDDANFFWDNTNKRLGIGTNTPSVRLEVLGTTMGDAALRTTGITVPGTFDLLRKNGTEASPTAVLTDDILSYVLFRGYDTVGEVDEGVRFTVTATENWTAGAHGSKLEIGTAVNGSSTIYTRMTIGEGGNVGIGTTTPDNPLHVYSSSTNVIKAERNSSSTNTSLRILELHRRTTGTAANNIGAELAFRVEDDGGGLETTATIQGILTDVSAASEEGALTFEVASDSSLVEGLRVQGISGGSSKVEITGQIEIMGGTPGIGKILTSDANGLATWDTAINDQASSGYFDIGTMRIAWGRISSTADGDQTVTFPASFGSAPVVATSMERDADAGYGAIDAVTTTNFVFNRVDTINNSDNPFIHYIAIGLKP